MFSKIRYNNENNALYTHMARIAYFIFFFLLFFASSFPAEVLADKTSKGNCLQCGKRKLSLCAEECLKVPSDKNRLCQSDCLHEYCSHACGLNKSDSKRSKELESLFSDSCEECKEQQFSRCDAECRSGSDYQRARCKLGCATVDCIDVCGGPPPLETQK